MTECVLARPAWSGELGSWPPDRALDYGLVEMMTFLLYGVPVPPPASLEEEPLPLPVPGCVGVLISQGVKHEHPAVTHDSGSNPGDLKNGVFFPVKHSLPAGMFVRYMGNFVTENKCQLSPRFKVSIAS